MKVCEDMFSLDIFRDELELAVSHLVSLEVSLGHFKHTPLQTISGQLCMNIVTLSEHLREVRRDLLLPCVLVTRVCPTLRV